MSLPQPAEYDDAIQNPSIAFLDADLKQSSNDGPMRFGMPGPVASGNFAIVYRMRLGQRRFAVKCFTREKTDQQNRYQIIHEHLASHNLPWTIDFQFIRQGIRVRNAVYPVLKMSWIDNAKTLLKYIEESIKNSQPLAPICEQFYQMTCDLERCSIAHGDLQHGNLIVSDGRLLLIDYDGMCVPKIVGMRSEEDGLPDYQHPLRQGGQLNLKLDRFPALIIWTSLYAINLDQTLWRRRVGDAERLLFKRQDFLSPNQSDLIRELRSYDDPKLKPVLEAIADSAYARDLNAFPHLSELLPGSSYSESTPWWQSKPVVEPKPSIGIPEWIMENERSLPRPVRFKGKTPVLGIFAATILTVALVMVVIMVGGMISLVQGAFGVAGSMLLFTVVFRVAYLRRSEVAEKEEAERELRVQLDKLQAAKVRLNTIVSPNLKRLAEIEKIIRDAEEEILKIEVQIDEVKRTASMEQHEFIRDLETKRLKVLNEEREALLKAGNIRTTAKQKADKSFLDIDRIVRESEGVHSTQVSALSQKLARERESKFEEKFGSYVNAELAKIDIGNNPVSGVSTWALNKAGFQTLADFIGHGGGGYLITPQRRYVKIQGVGSARGSDLERWRNRKVAEIRSKIPQAQRDAVVQQIEVEMNLERKRLASALESVRSKAEADKRAIQKDLAESISSVEQLETVAKSRAKLALDELKGKETHFRVNSQSALAKSLEALNRKLWTVQSISNPNKHKLKSEQFHLKQVSAKSEADVAEAQHRVDEKKQIVGSYKFITQLRFVWHAMS